MSAELNALVVGYVGDRVGSSATLIRDGDAVVVVVGTVVDADVVAGVASFVAGGPPHPASNTSAAVPANNTRPCCFTSVRPPRIPTRVLALRPSAPALP